MSEIDWRDGNGESTAISRFVGSEVERVLSSRSAWAVGDIAEIEWLSLQRVRGRDLAMRIRAFGSEFWRTAHGGDVDDNMIVSASRRSLFEGPRGPGEPKTDPSDGHFRPQQWWRDLLAERDAMIRELRAEAEQRRRYIAQVHSTNRTMTALNDELAAERDRARDLAAHLEDELARADERWCCDGYMSLVSREQVTTWADGEHVLCGSCEQNQRFGEDMMRDVARACDEAAASTTGSALWAADLIREAVGLFPSTAAHLEAEQAEEKNA